MQNFTNEHLFYKEQQDCLLEGVPLVDLNYSNNQAILDTFMEVRYYNLDADIIFVKIIKATGYLLRN